MTVKAGNPNEHVQYFFTAAELAANKPKEFIAPVDGWIGALRVITDVLIVTGGTIVVKTGPASAVTVANLLATVPNASPVGAILQSVLTDKQRGDATCKVAKGDRIQIFPASFTGGGAVSGYISIATADTSPQAGFTTPSGA